MAAINYFKYTPGAGHLAPQVVKWFKWVRADYPFNSVQMLEAPSGMGILNVSLSKSLSEALEIQSRTSVNAKQILADYHSIVAGRAWKSNSLSALWLIKKMMLDVSPHPTLGHVYGQLDIVMLEYMGDEKLGEFMLLFRKW